MRFSGTGGTISGVGRFLKTLSPGLKVILADPEGSGLYNKVDFHKSLRHGVNGL